MCLPAKCGNFSQFWPFNISYFRNDLAKILFLALVLLGHVECRGPILKCITLVQLARLGATLDPRRVPAVDSTSRQIPWRDRGFGPANWYGVTQLVIKALHLFLPPYSPPLVLHHPPLSLMLLRPWRRTSSVPIEWWSVSTSLLSWFVTRLNMSTKRRSKRGRGHSMNATCSNLQIVFCIDMSDIVRMEHKIQHET
jgi:hypothetical protein